MNNSLPNSAEELKEFLRYLDKFLLGKAIEWAKKCYQAILEQMDTLIAENRSDGTSIEHRREVWFQTCLGAVKIKRRQYQDGEGGWRYFLDEIMGMSKNWHTTVSVQELALEMASMMPYRRSAEVLRKTSAIDLPHQTIWRMIARVVDPYLEQEKRELKWFMETGELPESEGKKVDRLLMEADGVMLALQREKEKKAEVKLGIAYEGWQKVSKDRYQTVNKTAYAAVADKADFWAGLSLKLYKVYDLCGVDTIVGGDGAGWVKEGASYVGGSYQLDRYHLHRELCAALGRDNQTKGRVWEACERGEVAVGLGIMADALIKAKGEQATRIARAYRYLQENSAGLVDYRLRLGEDGKTLRHTGAIEGNVNQFVARRMKNQGMSWRLRGISRLLCVRFLILEKKLPGWLKKRTDLDTRTKITLPRKQMRRVVTRLSIQEPDEWIKAKLPALYGPHAYHPWVRALKSLSQVSAI